MNSSNKVACKLLELKITVVLLPECHSDGTTATLTEVSAVGACLLPLSVLLDVNPYVCSKGSKAGPTAGTQHDLCQLGYFFSDSSVTFLL